MPIEPFEFTYTLTSQASENEALNAIGKARVKEFEPKSYFFTESGLTPQTDATGAYGPDAVDSETKFNITTQFALTNKKAYAVTSGQVLIVPQTGSTTKVNVFIKPLNHVDVGVPIKYYVYRGLKKESFIETKEAVDYIVAEGSVSNPFMAKVWTDLKGVNTDLGTDPVPATVFGFNTADSDDTKVDAKFFYVADTTETEEHKIYNLPNIVAGQHFGEFADDEGGFEIVLNDGFYHQEKSDTGFEFDLKYAKSAKVTLDINAITDPTVSVKIYRENVQKFLDPAAFYGAHITEKGKGQITVVDNSAKYSSKEDIFTHIVDKFHNKHKCYLYIQCNRGRSFNFDEVLGTEPLKIGVAGVVSPVEYKTDGWPIIISEFDQTHDTDETDAKKAVNNLSFELKFKTVSKKASLYNTHGNNSSEAIEGEFLGTKALVDESNIATQEYTNTINYKLINNYDAGSSSLVMKGITSFIYANIFEKEDENESISNLFGPINIKPIATKEPLNANGLVEKVRLYKNRLEKKGDTTNTYNFSTYYDKGETNLNRRLFILKKIDSTDSKRKPEFQSLNPTIDYKQIKSKEDYSDFVFGNSDNEVIEGIFYDSDKSIYVASLQLINFKKEGNVTNQKMIGLEEADINKLIYNDIVENTSNHIPANATNIFLHIDTDSAVISDRYKRYKLGVTYETSSIFGNGSPKYPDSPNEVYIYTVDDHFFFTYNYSLNFNYSEKFATYNFINFRPKSSSILGVGFDWLRIGDNNETSYKDSIISGYDEKEWTVLGSDTKFDNPVEAYAALKKEYIHICTGRGITVPYDNDYFVPFLSMYPITASECTSDNSEITLTAKIRNHPHDTPALKYTLEYDASLFEITHAPFPTTITTTDNPHNVDFTIKCLKEFSTDQIIKVIAHTQSNSNEYVAQNIAGLIKVCKNSIENRKRIKIILVNVKTNIDSIGAPEEGSIEEIEKSNLQRVLNQALIYADIEGPINLDFSDHTIDNGWENFITGQGYIDNNGHIITTVGSTPGYDAKQDFLKEKIDEKYKNHFKIFTFDLHSNGKAGNAQTIGKHSACLYNPRIFVTMAHEVCHGLGLYHTHSDGDIDNSNQKYTYHYGVADNDRMDVDVAKSTDNIMSYNPNKKSSWYWQWDLLHKHLKNYTNEN